VFLYGPVEWLWRGWTYMKRPPFVRTLSPDACTSRPI
jgi:uncharacterized membrane protein YeiB